jgi:hypothetical protein
MNVYFSFAGAATGARKDEFAVASHGENVTLF